MQQRTVIAFLGGLLIALLASPGHAVTQKLSCTIDGMQEVPSNGSAGTGFGQFTIDTAANTLDFHIEFDNLSSAESAAHIHGPAAPGINGPIVFGLPAGTPKTGTWNYPQNLEGALLTGRMYVNIHSSMFPAGEIRGQIVKSKIVRYTATLDGAQETPPNGSTATGTGTFLIDTVANVVDFNVSFSGLTSPESVSHFHSPAAIGVPGPIVFGVGPGSPKIGSWNYLQSMEADILGGLTYFNIHTTMFPDGEIRGQLLEDCGPGRVNLGGGAPQEVLTVNASAGLPGCRVVTVPVNTDITVALASSMAGPANGNYILYAWACPPQNPVDLTVGPNNLGCFGNPTPLQGGDPQPFRCLRGGLPASVCAGVREINGPPTTPFSVTKSGGLSNPLTVLLQALVEDTGAPLNHSVTNFVVLVVE